MFTFVSIIFILSICYIHVLCIFALLYCFLHFAVAALKV
jgi:hypothetical protein